VRCSPAYFPGYKVAVLNCPKHSNMAPEPPKKVGWVTFWSMLALASVTQIFGPLMLVPPTAREHGLAFIALGILVGLVSALMSVLLLRWAWWFVSLIVKAREG
jgi:hypothetical protein